jgi:hypothetical protein
MPTPFVPIDTPTLPPPDELELRVESVFVVLTRVTRFFAARSTSVAFTSEPTIVTSPLPGVLLPVATNAAVPPACAVEPRCVV